MRLEDTDMICAECQAECDDFYFNETGEFVSNCKGCLYSRCA